MRRRLAVFVAIIQTLLFAGHAFVYATALYFWPSLAAATNPDLKITLALLSITFVTASLLALRYSNIVIRIYYTVSALWLGTFSFLFFACCALWPTYGVFSLAGLHPDKGLFAFTFLTVALLASLYGIMNAAATRVKRITVKLDNLPSSWSGRTAALVSDVHLGHVRNMGFIRRIGKLVAQLKPDLIFITGDLYDGTAADLNHLAEPWAALAPPLGKYFVLGNHEGFTDSTRYLNAVASAGIRILNKEKVELDGLQLVGVHYHDVTHAEHFRTVLQSISIDRSRPCILLTHAPDHVPVSAEAGISLQLNGHTHGGQFFPFNLFVKRIYGPFAYGLNELATLQVYTTSGAGTWGPPMRVGTNPEIVLIKFE
ncbi:MAG: metallophosphoesterase [Candidatus Acidiferrales bacterium]